MTNVFAVVGEHRREPERLLLLGDDGRYYALTADGRPVEVQPSNSWRLDTDATNKRDPDADPPAQSPITVG